MLVILGICFWEQLYNFFWYLDFSLTEKLKGNGWCSQERFRGRWNEILHLKHSVYSLTHCKSSVKLVCSYWGSTWPPLRQNSEISALLPPTLTFLSITTRWQPVVLHTWQGSLPKLLDKLSSTKRHRDRISGYDLFAWEPRSQNIKQWKDVFHLHSWVELECSRQEQRSRQTDGLVCCKWNVVSYTVYKDSLDAFIVWGDSSLSRWVLKK